MPYSVVRELYRIQMHFHRLNGNIAEHFSNALSVSSRSKEEKKNVETQFNLLLRNVIRKEMHVIPIQIFD